MLLVVDQFDDAKTFVDGIEQTTITLFRFVQGLLRPLSHGHITRGAEPFGDFTACIQQRYRPRQGPTEAAVYTSNPVFQLKKTLGADRFVDDRHYVRLILWGKVFLNPAAAWRWHIGNKLLAIELAYFAIIRAHAVHHIRASGHQRAKALLALQQGCFVLLALGDVLD